MRFRQHPVAVSADISEMFMQIKIKPEDRDALRYGAATEEMKNLPSTGWDDEIDQDLATQWNDWKSQLINLKHKKIPRCYLRYTDATTLQLHTFVDASETTYAAALYWRATGSQGHVSTSLIIAKSRVAPLTITSIPRLELQAAVMGSRMATAVIEEHDRKPNAKFYWMDSKTVLTWLKNGARSYKPFVAHRIAALEENSTLNAWRWVPTYKTERRGRRDPKRTSKFRSMVQWVRIPTARIEQLANRKAYHFNGNRRRENTSSNSQETRFRYSGILCRKNREKVNYKRTKRNSEKDPSWTKSNKKSYKRTSNKHEIRKYDEVKTLPIDIDLLCDAEKLLQRACQQQSFSQEISDLRNGITISTRSRLYKLSIEIHDNIIRIKTRIGGADGLTEMQKHPPLLCGDHHITRLYIEHTHRQLHHAGAEATINECRQYYYITRLRTVTRGILRRCIPCQIRRASPASPPTGDHLSNRLAHQPTPVHLHGNRLLRAANSENRSCYD
ncbi:hypothetical protein EVAR_98428_1 [Eumeta japonica]|uniref:Integrase zinc-binding domain-containing protein n=1 Tax=Eumeta variegata TaxID=151549 RepID=A0A4C2AAC7_EUMVA|nr:hypothetical protein EVAR_98428_1 [Eumeta japonica]